MSLRALIAVLVWVVSTAVHAVPTVTVAPTSGFGYIPLSLFGGNTNLALGDDAVENINLPAFLWAGQSWSSVGVSSNGYLVVGGASAGDNSATNLALPNTAAPRHLLAPYWTDLDPTLGGAIRANVLTDGVGSWIVIDWDAVQHADGSGPSSFEVWIGINGFEDIWFTYGNMSAPLDGMVTVGAQDASGTVGSTVYYNGTGTLPVAGTELRVSTTDLPITAVPEPGSMALAGLALLVLARVHWNRRAARHGALTRS